MRIQLWSYNYAPEPLGIGPVSRVWALAMAERGYEVEVVAAHPHYPEPRWGWRAFPYREVREGIPVLRLPLIPGRSSGVRRLLQEVSFTVSQTLASPFLGKPDAIIAVSPCFPALLPAMIASRARRVPLVIWLKDILPDGAVSTGYLTEGSFGIRLARRFERAAYREAEKVVVLSETFRDNLLSKGVPSEKIVRIYDPATRPLVPRPPDWSVKSDPPEVLCMGNIGKSQNLPTIVQTFEDNQDLAKMGARLIITGTGVAEHEVRSVVKTDRVQLKGLVSDEQLTTHLVKAHMGAVTQHYEGSEFNVPSKVMNYMGAALPVVASVHPTGEIAQLLKASKAGWVTNSERPEAFAAQVADALTRPEELASRSRNAWEFAQTHFSASGLADAFEELLKEVVGS